MLAVETNTPVVTTRNQRDVMRVHGDFLPPMKHR